MFDIDIIWGKIVRERDEKTFNIFFDYYYPRLVRFSLEYVKFPSVAEDIVSDVIYKLLVSQRRKDKIKSINAYLFRAVRNKSLTWLRDKKKMLNHENLEESSDFLIYEINEDNASSKDYDVKRLFDHALGNLPKQRQLVFRLIREDGLRPNEVSELLNISIRTVEKHMQLTIKELCIQLKEHIRDQRHHSKIRKLFPRRFNLFFL